MSMKMVLACRLFWPGLVLQTLLFSHSVDGARVQKSGKPVDAQQGKSKANGGETDSGACLSSPTERPRQQAFLDAPELFAGNMASFLDDRSLGALTAAPPAKESGRELLLSDLHRRKERKERREMLDRVWAILKEKTGNLVALENYEAGFVTAGLSDWFVSRWRGVWIDTEALLVGRGRGPTTRPQERSQSQELDAIESGWPRVGYLSDSRIPFPDHLDLVKLVDGAQVLVKPATTSLHWNWDAESDDENEIFMVFLLRSESVSRQADVLPERLREYFLQKWPGEVQQFCPRGRGPAQYTVRFPRVKNARFPLSEEDVGEVLNISADMLYVRPLQEPERNPLE